MLCSGGQTDAIPPRHEPGIICAPTDRSLQGFCILMATEVPQVRHLLLDCYCRPIQFPAVPGTLTVEVLARVTVTQITPPRGPLDFAQSTAKRVYYHTISRLSSQVRECILNE